MFLSYPILISIRVHSPAHDCIACSCPCCSLCSRPCSSSFTSPLLFTSFLWPFAHPSQPVFLVLPFLCAMPSSLLLLLFFCYPLSFFSPCFCFVLFCSVPCCYLCYVVLSVISLFPCLREHIVCSYLHCWCFLGVTHVSVHEIDLSIDWCVFGGELDAAMVALYMSSPYSSCCFIHTHFILLLFFRSPILC